jgi:hypothetical protein
MGDSTSCQGIRTVSTALSQIAIRFQLLKRGSTTSLTFVRSLAPISGPWAQAADASRQLASAIPVWSTNLSPCSGGDAAP